MIKEHRVLDHGLIRLVDHMGSDLSIARNAASGLPCGNGCIH